MSAFCFIVAVGWWALWGFDPTPTPLESQTYCLLVALWTMCAIIVSAINRRSAK